MDSLREELSSQQPKFATHAVHAGYSTEICSDKPIVPPIFLSSTYEYDTVENPATSFYYARCGNRSRDILEKTIAVLEEADYGLCYSSGMATIFSVMYLLNPGDHIICSPVLYGGTMKLLKQYAIPKGIDVTSMDLLDMEEVKKAVKDNTKMIYTESCCNPLLTVVDIEALAAIARQKPNLLLVVDNTFITPCFQKPLKQGADIVLHSATKYLNGHGDVVMGVLATNRPCLYKKLQDMQTSLGFVPSPFDCYLVHRGLKTIHLRMREHMKNAFETAEFLESHHMVTTILYPGLPSHPQHALAKKQFTGYGGVLGFYIQGGRKQVEKFVGSLKMIKVTGSLGQPNTVICYPATVSHSNVDPDERRLIGIADNYVRLALGLEAATDIIQDLKQALDSIRP